MANSLLSVRARFLFSVGANGMRALVSLLVGLVVARGLGPAEYGNLAYLLGSFWALRALLDGGSASAFYTFISQKRRSRYYYLVYFGWLAFQFVFSVALVAVLLPASLIDAFWLGQSREMILLALLASFLQQQVWQTVVQVYESARKTWQAQLASFLVISAHLLLLAVAMELGWLSVRTVLALLVAEYLLASVVLGAAFRAGLSAEDGEPGEEPLAVVVAAYARYCRPMAVIALFTFAYELADRWLLQRYGGSSQQGFYQVASQLSTISLLATASILNILWKEVAEARERGDNQRVIRLYRKASRFLILLSATVACFLAPWAKTIVSLLLGPAYEAAWPALFVMLLFPIHQTLGQISGMLLMATGHTQAYMKLSVAGLLVSMPVSYFLLAPAEGAPWLPGLGLGAMGLSAKIVFLNVLLSNLQAWIVCRLIGARYEWAYQAVGVGLLLAIGFVAKTLVEWVAPGVSVGGDKLSLALAMALAGVVYLPLMMALFWRLPLLGDGIVGDVRGLLLRVVALKPGNGVDPK